MRPNTERWLVIGLLLATSAYAFAEDLTVTTYYPSPRGVYEELRTSGDVKIGDSSSTAPQGRLEIRGSTAATTAKALYVGNLSGAPRLVVEDGGNVGIGTASPSVTLHVMGDIKADAGQVQVGNFSADPVSALGDGAIYYNTTTNRFRGRQAGSWQNLGKISYTAEYVATAGVPTKMIHSSDGFCFLTYAVDGSNGGPFSVYIDSDGFWYVHNNWSGFEAKARCALIP